jgi:ketose-bisphosphate aldolase
MRFTNAKPLVLDAQRRGYAVPALNANGATYDIARAALEAAQELQAPLILQSYEPNLEYRGMKYFVTMSGFLCDDLGISVPVALHIDHGKTYESALRAMEAGFTSYMFDASHDPLEENISKTKRVLDLARGWNVSIEAEVGYVKGNEPKKEKQVGRIVVPEKPIIQAAKTTIEEVVRFVSEVDVDMLAVSVGTTHGVYKIQSEIDFQLLKEIRSKIDIPLVQHGTCGISLENISKLSSSGMSKINFGEALRFNYINYFNELTDAMEHHWHAWKIMREIKNRLKSDIKELIRALGADGKAF